MKTVETSAKKVDDAIREGLKLLDATMDEVDIKVLDPGGFFKKAKVRLTLAEPGDGDVSESELLKEQISKTKALVKEEPKPTKFVKEEKKDMKPAQQKAVGDAAKPAPADKNKGFKKERLEKTEPVTAAPKKFMENSGSSDKFKSKASYEDRLNEPAKVDEKLIADSENFIKNVARLMEIDDLKITSKAHGKDLDVTIETASNALIGFRGETLEALQYLTGLAVNKGDDKYVKILLNCNSYREKREEDLVRLAQKMAQKCISSNHKVSLEPMNSSFRRIIHAALSDNLQVTTKSEGKEPNRRVVIYCKREPSFKPQPKQQ